MKIFRRKELRDIWTDERAMITKYRRTWDSSPVLRRFYKQLWDTTMEDVKDGPVFEIGGGAGFIKEYYPQVISSDRLPFAETDVVCDATRLPLADESVGAFVAVAFFHHCANQRSLFSEISRCLKPGGRFVIYDPYISLTGRLVYKFGTEEALDMTEAPLDASLRPYDCPLLEANVARATLLFDRNPGVLERAFPELRVVKVDRQNMFRHIAAGSCVQQSPFPDWCYPIAYAVDQILRPFAKHIALTMKVVIEKTDRKGTIG